MPIRIDDVYALAKKLKPLTERDLSLFTLEDFVQVGTVDADVATFDPFWSAFDEPHIDHETDPLTIPIGNLPAL